MHIVKTSLRNHTITIINDDIKRGITIGNVGEDIMAYLINLTINANKAMSVGLALKELADISQGACSCNPSESLKGCVCGYEAKRTEKKIELEDAIAKCNPDNAGTCLNCLGKDYHHSVNCYLGKTEL